MITKISVLIPTYNAEKYIEPLLSSLRSQVLRGDQELEIIVVDSSSRDRTMDIVRTQFPDVLTLIIDNKSFDHGGTRNKMASMATGDYLLFMTQDAIPYDSHLIQSLLRAFEDEQIKVSYARQVPKKDANPLEVFARTFNYPNRTIVKDKSSLKKLGIKTFFNSNVCSMYRRDEFFRLGQFPEKIILNEDMIFSSKVILNGYKVSYSADAMVYHSHNYSLKQQYKRYFDIGMAFSDTKYLLEHASNEKEGFRMVLRQTRYLIRNRKIHWIPYAFLETVFKYVGYRLGRRHSMMPRRIKKLSSAYMK